jgi:hypothetical protein
MQMHRGNQVYVVDLYTGNRIPDYSRLRRLLTDTFSLSPKYKAVSTVFHSINNSFSEV